jgi:hypothetical protein
MSSCQGQQQPVLYLLLAVVHLAAAGVLDNVSEQHSSYVENVVLRSRLKLAQVILSPGAH